MGFSFLLAPHTHTHMRSQKRLCLAERRQADRLIHTALSHHVCVMCPPHLIINCVGSSCVCVCLPDESHFDDGAHAGPVSTCNCCCRKLVSFVVCTWLNGVCFVRATLSLVSVCKEHFLARRARTAFRCCEARRVIDDDHITYLWCVCVCLQVCCCVYCCVWRPLFDIYIFGAWHLDKQQSEINMREPTIQLLHTY